MEKILFFINFSKNNIVVPQNATKATKTTVEVTWSEVSWKAIWTCATKICRYMLIVGDLSLKTWSFDHNLAIVKTDFWDIVSDGIWKKMFFSFFEDFLPSKIAQICRKIMKKSMKFNLAPDEDFDIKILFFVQKLNVSMTFGTPKAPWYPENNICCFLTTIIQDVQK